MSKKEKNIEDDGEKKIKLSTLVYAILILIIFVFGVACVLAYATNTEIGMKIKTRIGKVVPFPAAIVNWNHIVFLNDEQKNLASVEKFYATQNFAADGLRIDFTTEDGKKRLLIKEREILDKMVEDQIIEILAKKKEIKITDEDAEKVLQQKLEEFGTADDVKKDLESSYGWGMEEFKSRVVLPALHAQALEKKVLDEDQSVQAAEETIKKAKRELEDGKDFAEVVRSYSQGSSKEKGGELGWVKKEQVMPELQSALFGSESFKKNSIIESSIGYHIIEVKDSKKEEDVEYLQLRQIFVSKNTFADWLEKQKKDFDVILTLKNFVWNKETGSVDFKDESLRKFEKESRAKVQGDASIMF